MTKKSMTLKFYADPGHGWLKVPMDRLDEWDIKKKISSYSYMKGKSVYLEEDCDAGIFLEEAKKRGYEVKIDHSHTNNQSAIRRYFSYQSWAVGYKPVIGEILSQPRYLDRDKNGFYGIEFHNDHAIVGIDGDKIELQGEGGGRPVIKIADIPRYFYTPEAIENNKKRYNAYIKLCSIVADLGVDTFQVRELDIEKDVFELALDSKGRHKTLLKGFPSNLNMITASFTASNLPYVPLSDIDPKVILNPDKYIEEAKR